MAGGRPPRRRPPDRRPLGHSRRKSDRGGRAPPPPEAARGPARGAALDVRCHRHPARGAGRRPSTSERRRGQSQDRRGIGRGTSPRARRPSGRPPSTGARAPRRAARGSAQGDPAHDARCPPAVVATESADTLKTPRRLIAAAIAAGWRGIPTRNGTMLRSPDGVTQVLVHHTPSDGRAMKNARAMLRRAGVVA